MINSTSRCFSLGSESCLCINPQCCTTVGVSHQFLNNLYILTISRSASNKCAKCVPADPSRNAGAQCSRPNAFHHHHVRIDRKGDSSSDSKFVISCGSTTVGLRFRSVLRTRLPD